MNQIFETLYYASPAKPIESKLTVAKIRELAEKFAGDYKIKLGLDNAPDDTLTEGKSQINEVFALFAASVVLLADKPNLPKRPGLDDLINGLWSASYEDLITVLRYRVVSRHAVAIILQSICEKGLKPVFYL